MILEVLISEVYFWASSGLPDRLVANVWPPTKAAAKCRQKAKRSVSDLQNRERELLQQNRLLAAHAGSLKEEVINLKNEILRHSHCDSDVRSSPSFLAGQDIGILNNTP